MKAKEYIICLKALETNPSAYYRMLKQFNVAHPSIAKNETTIENLKILTEGFDFLKTNNVYSKVLWKGNTLLDTLEELKSWFEDIKEYVGPNPHIEWQDATKFINVVVSCAEFDPISLKLMIEKLELNNGVSND